MLTLLSQATIRRDYIRGPAQAGVEAVSRILPTVFVFVVGNHLNDKFFFVGLIRDVAQGDIDVVMG